MVGDRKGGKCIGEIKWNRASRCDSPSQWRHGRIDYQVIRDKFHVRLSLHSQGPETRMEKCQTMAEFIMRLESLERFGYESTYQFILLFGTQQPILIKMFSIAIWIMCSGAVMKRNSPPAVCNVLTSLSLHFIINYLLTSLRLASMKNSSAFNQINVMNTLSQKLSNTNSISLLNLFWAFFRHHPKGAHSLNSQAKNKRLISFHLNSVSCQGF